MIEALIDGLIIGSLVWGAYFGVGIVCYHLMEKEND